MPYYTVHVAPHGQRTRKIRVDCFADCAAASRHEGEKHGIVIDVQRHMARGELDEGWTLDRRKENS